MKLNDTLMGGGFGRRGNRDVDFIIDAVLMSKEAGRPVKVMWTREDDIANGRFRPISAHALKAGFDPPQAGRRGSTASPSTASGPTWIRCVTRQRAARISSPCWGPICAAMTCRISWWSSSTATPACAPICAGSASPTGSRPNRSSTRSAKQGKDLLAYHLAPWKGTPRAIKVVERVAQMADWGKKRRRPSARLAYLDYSGSQVAGIAEISLNRTSGEIKVHNFWCTIDCGVAAAGQ